MNSTDLPKRASRYNHQLPIESGYHSNLWVRPLIIWCILAVIFICVCFPDKEDGYYNFALCFELLGGLTLVVGLVALYNFAATWRIYIDEERLIFIGLSGKPKESYFLKNIRRFTWNNQPRVSSTGRSGAQMILKNEVIEIYFDEEPISLSFDEYGNFDEIKCYLYDYCLDHGIVKKRPLSERRRSSL